MRTEDHPARILENVTTEEGARPSRIEGMLALSVVCAIGLSLFAIIAVIVATGVGVRTFDSNFWHLVVVLPAFGLPLGVLLIVTLLIVNFARRQRENVRSR